VGGGRILPNAGFAVPEINPRGVAGQVDDINITMPSFLTKAGGMTNARERANLHSFLRIHL
jgi:hypothetical protein